MIGISKLTRLVHLYSRRFSVQERLGQQIADTLNRLLQPHGVAVYLEARHLCVEMRGVRDEESIEDMPDVTDIAVDAFVAVGSNIDPQENVRRALTILKTYVSITAVSTFYRTAAVDRPDQPDFINGVVGIRTARSPREVKFDVLRRIESQLGRVRSADKYAARTIDLDLVLYGAMVVDQPDLHLPDASIRRYPFVAVPLVELACDLVLPDTRTPLSDEPVIKAGADMQTMPEFTQSLRGLVLS
jgi:2-amino-4-hydroxy-6-hydroxymethyldihydropteridine diphosphokinase